MKFLLKKIFLLVAVSIAFCLCINAQTNTGSIRALQINPGENNPRNSEGDFITLKNGRILFIYSHFSGNSGSGFGNAYLASRYSTDKGKTWDKVKDVENDPDGSFCYTAFTVPKLTFY